MRFRNSKLQVERRTMQNPDLYAHVDSDTPELDDANGTDTEPSTLEPTISSPVESNQTTGTEPYPGPESCTQDPPRPSLTLPNPAGPDRTEHHRRLSLPGRFASWREVQRPLFTPGEIAQIAIAVGALIVALIAVV
ncbi:hypothetical protein K440DRAFT_636139 [Wilcoxina mikolae CBS 423.85]|nr:hypothetical protein K440DRAFT_636139 [Wilcoxina mikolae CBS 423.85]